MYCINCGNKVDDNAYACVGCGVILKKNNTINRPKKKNNNGNIIGILCIILSVISIALSFSCFLVDISDVGMYTKFYERLFYAVDLTLPAIGFTVLSFVLSLIKNNKWKRIGLVLSLISAFLIITEFMVVVIY